MKTKRFLEDSRPNKQHTASKNGKVILCNKLDIESKFLKILTNGVLVPTKEDSGSPQLVHLEAVVLKLLR